MKEILIKKNYQFQIVLKYIFLCFQNFNKKELCRNKKINGNISYNREGAFKVVNKIGVKNLFQIFKKVCFFN